MNRLLERWRFKELKQHIMTSESENFINSNIEELPFIKEVAKKLFDNREWDKGSSDSMITAILKEIPKKGPKSIQHFFERVAFFYSKLLIDNNISVKVGHQQKFTLTKENTSIFIELWKFIFGDYDDMSELLYTLEAEKKWKQLSIDDRRNSLMGYFKLAPFLYYRLGFGSLRDFSIKLTNFCRANNICRGFMTNINVRKPYKRRKVDATQN